MYVVSASILYPFILASRNEFSRLARWSLQGQETIQAQATIYCPVTAEIDFSSGGNLWSFGRVHRGEVMGDNDGGEPE